MRSVRASVAMAAVLLMAVVLAPAGAAAPAGAVRDEVEIRVLSNRADAISGGDAFVEVVLPPGTDPTGLQAEIDGRDVSSGIALRESGRVVGLVDGLAEGPNELTVRLADGRGARVTITNHPIGGPVFSGPQVWPWLCETEGSGLGPAVDEQCNAETVVDWYYVPSGSSSLEPYDPDDPPDDVSTTTTDEGNEVPFIVRRERGTMNRGIYAFAVLYDPSQPWEPWAPQAGWNGKILWPFGASSGNQYRQASPLGVLTASTLGRGVAMANHSLNNNGNNSNTVTNAESVMMLKEHIGETLGEIRYVIGEGGSGGAIGQQTVANAYPGLLDGIRPTLSYPDVWTTRLEVADCVQLNRYFNSISPHLWGSAHQRAAVSGHNNPASCTGWEVLFGANADPAVGCGLPDEQTYHPQDNPGGARCSTQDLQASIWGPRPEEIWNDIEQSIGRGFAGLVYDNVGIQFGLGALQSGEITTEQFVDLNEKIGGHDVDRNFTDERAVADPGTAATAIRGRIVNDGAGLNEVAIIDSRSTGDIDPLLIHTMHHTFALRERIRRVHGNADTHVTWRGGTPENSFDVMDRWLAGVEADTSDDPRSVKLVRHKPPEAVDMCFAAGQRINMTQCETVWPYFGAPRTVAGAPMTHDYMKCELKPLDRFDAYGLVPFTDAQWERLQAAFPDGVCDYSKPPAGFEPSIGWATYADGPGGRSMGDAPSSTPLS